MNNKKWYLIAFVFLLITYTKLFEFRPAAEFFNKLLFVVFFILLVFTLGNFSYKKGIFIKPIKYIIYSLFLAIIPCVMFWDQSLVQSFIAVAPFSYFLLFLFLIKARINRELIVKTILVCAYISLIAFTYQFVFPETVLFGLKEEIIEDRGISRIVFPAEGFMFFALFYYLNKLGRNFKLKYLLLFLPFFLMMLVQVTRMYYLAFGLIAIYHFMIKSKLLFRIVIISIFIFCYSFFYNSGNKTIEGIRNANDVDVERKEDNIRLISATYFLFEFPKDPINYFLGSGAYNYNSSYGKKILNLNENEFFYLEDIGILKGYVLFGVLFVLGYVLIFIKSFTMKIPHNQLYLQYFIWMILILSFTTRANTNAGFGVVLVSVLYLFELAYLEQNNLIAAKSPGMLKRNFNPYKPSKNIKAT